MSLSLFIDLMLSRHAEDYEKEHSIAARDVTNYLSNPINDYLLVKRLASDWYKTEKLMQDPFYEGKFTIQFKFMKTIRYKTYNVGKKSYDFSCYAKSYPIS